MNAISIFSRSLGNRTTRWIAPRLVFLVITCALTTNGSIAADPADKPPTIPFGADAITQWERWPYLRIGVRAYMRSTFDRTGGNFYADAAHYLRQTDD